MKLILYYFKLTNLQMPFFLGNRGERSDVSRGPPYQPSPVCRNRSTRLENEFGVSRLGRHLPVSAVLRPRPPLQDAPPFAPNQGQFRPERGHGYEHLVGRIPGRCQKTSRALPRLLRREEGFPAARRALAVQADPPAVDLPAVRSPSAGSVRQEDGRVCRGRRTQAAVVRIEACARAVEEEAQKVGTTSEQEVFATVQRQQQDLRRLQDQPGQPEVRVRAVQDLLQGQVLQRRARLFRT